MFFLIRGVLFGSMVLRLMIVIVCVVIIRIDLVEFLCMKVMVLLEIES